MNKMGITRRIDTLGRIVIPKNIRKSLRINDSDELEISLSNDQIILIKKDSLDANKIINVIIDVLAHQINKNVLVTSKEQIIASFIIDKQEYQNLTLSDYAIDIIQKRKLFYSSIIKVNLFNSIDEMAYVISPLIINGDLVGSIIAFSKNDFTKEDQNWIRFSNRFLEKYLEQ